MAALSRYFVLGFKRERVIERPSPDWRERYGSTVARAPEPSPFKTGSAESRSYFTGNVRPALAPVQTGPTENAGGSALRSIELHAEVRQEFNSSVSEHSAFESHLQKATLDHAVCHPDGDGSGEMVIARAHETKLRIAGTDLERAGLFPNGRELAWVTSVNVVEFPV
jgi:hypothetical protein